MSAIAYILLGVAVTVALLVAWNSIWSFRAQRLQDYVPGAPVAAPSLRDALTGKFEAHGLIFDYTGRAKSRFIADIEGVFDAEGGTLSEEFRYGSGAVDRRQWTISFAPDGKTFTATAPDVIGEGKGEMLADSIRMTYRLKLPERAGGHVLDVVDWLYVMEDGAIVNRSEMRKFGFKAAELIAVFRRPAVEARAQVAAE